VGTKAADSGAAFGNAVQKPGAGGGM
jgi:hypothetical protein